MDGNCPVQIVVDQLCRTPEDLLQLHRDYPPGPSPSVAGIAGGGMNTVKVTKLPSFPPCMVLI